MSVRRATAPRRGARARHRVGWAGRRVRTSSSSRHLLGTRCAPPSPRMPPRCRSVAAPYRQAARRAVRLPGGAVAQRASTSRESSRVSTATECAATLSCIAMPSVPTAPPSARVDAEAASRSRRACRSRCATNTCKCCPTSAASAAAVATSASRRRSARSSKARRTWPSATLHDLGDAAAAARRDCRPSPHRWRRRQDWVVARTTRRPAGARVAAPCQLGLSSGFVPARVCRYRVVASGALAVAGARQLQVGERIQDAAQRIHIHTELHRRASRQRGVRSYSSATCSQPSTSRPAVSRLRHRGLFAAAGRAQCARRSARRDAGCERPTPSEFE